MTSPTAAPYEHSANIPRTFVDLELVGQLFEVFHGELESLNLIVNEGKIIDASFVEVPKQHGGCKKTRPTNSGTRNT